MIRRRRPKTGYLEFHKNLLGFICYYKGREVPKYILYWRGHSYFDILNGKTDIELRSRGSKY